VNRTDYYGGKKMRKIEPEYAIVGETVQKIRIGETEIPCCTTVDNLERVDSLMKSLLEYGVFTFQKDGERREIKSETNEDEEKRIRDFIANLGENERLLFETLSTENWLSKTEIDLRIMMKRRDFHEALANLSRKARVFGLIDKGEQLHEQKFVPEEFHYKLKPIAKKIKEFMN
jgi:hypothetical protein